MVGILQAEQVEPTFSFADKFLVALFQNGQFVLGKSAVGAYPKVYGEAALPVLDKAKEEYKLLWPVNVSTLTADPELKQTWGYNEAEGK